MPEQTISLSNSRYGGTTTLITGYAIDTSSQHRLLGVDFCPKHPKEQGALWSELVSGSPRWLFLKDNTLVGKYGTYSQEYNVIGMGSRYERLPIDVPEISIPMSGNVRPKAIRCFHPLLHHIDNERKDDDRRQRFYIMDWPGRTFGQTFASEMERDLAYPMLLEFGDALFQYGIDHGNITKLLTAGTFPEGYEVIRPSDGWLIWLSEAVRDGIISISDVKEITNETI